MSAKKATSSKLEYSKLYYPISEVAKLAGVKAHVLRYWESEFPSLKPRKTRTGSRRYRPADIDEIMSIKDLLYDQGFKIAGARKMLRTLKKKKPAPAAVKAPQMALKFAGMDDAQKLAFLKSELQEILGLIKELTPDSAAKAAKEMKAKG